MKKITILSISLILILMLTQGLSLITINTDSKITTKLGDGTFEITVTLPDGGGNNTTAYLELPRGSPVYNSRLNLTSSPDGYGNYPSNITLDVGDDGDIEWQFNGFGYGSMGRQTEFESGKIEEKIFLKNTSYNSTVCIKLPRNAHITKSVMNITSGGGNILIVQDGADTIGINLTIQALEDEGYTTTLAPSESALPPNWDDPSTYHGIFWFGGTSYSTGMPDNTNAGKMVTYVQNGGSVFITGAGVDSTHYPGNPGPNEVNFLNWVTHHYCGNQWGGGMTGTGSDTYKTTCVTNSAHDIFNTPNTLPSSWTGDITYSCAFWWNPSGTLNNGVVQAKAGSPLNSDLYGDIWTWDGPSYDPSYGRTVLVRHPIARSWRITDQGDMLTPFVQNIAHWTVGAHYTLKDCTLDVGDTGGIKDWDYPGAFNGTVTTDDFSDKLNDHVLPSLPYFEDDYGNRFVKIPLNFTSITNGGFIISNLEIEYNYTALVDINPHNGNLTTELNELINSAGSGQGNVTIPLAISAYSGGNVTISGIYIEYDAPPIAITIPSTYKVDEDTLESHLIDLSGYFIDDYQLSTALIYNVVSNSQSSIIDVFVYDSYYLGVDALTGTNNDNWFGTLDVVLNATDNIGFTTNSNKFTITISPVNDPPKWNDLQEIHVEEDKNFEDAIDLPNMVSDVDNNTSSDLKFTIIINSNPTNISVIIDGDNNLDIVLPVEHYVGSANITIRADDGINYTDEQFEIIINPINDPPVIITEDLETASTDKLYEVDYNATDVDLTNDTLTWLLVTDASWLGIDTTSGVLSGTPTIDDIGYYEVNVTVNDGNDGVDWHKFILTVVKGNNPPIITTTDVVSATLNVLYYVDYIAIDDHTPLDQLLWALETNASWLNLETNTGILSGTPAIGDLGRYWLNISVSDGEGGFAFHDFTLTVYSTANQPPEITNEDVPWAEMNVEYSVDYEATDDRTPSANLQWYLKSNATWLNINLYNGELSGTPTTDDVGIYYVEVSVFDTEDGWDIHNFTLMVLREPQPEDIIRLTNPTITPSDGDTETEFTFTIHYFHLNSQEPLYVQLIIDGELNNMTLVPGESPANGIYTVTLKLTEGVHTYYFVTSDGPNVIMTDKYTTPDITKAGRKDTADKTSWDWLIWVVIIIIILIIMAVLFIYKKRKEEKTPTVKAELLSASPAHMALPSVTAGEEGASPLPSPVVVAEQFPTPKAPIPSLAPVSTKPVPQLPQATLSKTQKLELLKERLLRGEITEETYKELKIEIESSTGGEIPEGEVEDLSTIDEQQPPEPIAVPPAITPQTDQPPTPTVEPQVVEPPQPGVPTNQVEQQAPQPQEPAMEQPAEPQGQAPVPKIKPQPTIKESDV